jgi:hypothetical protein
MNARPKTFHPVASANNDCDSEPDYAGLQSAAHAGRQAAHARSINGWPRGGVVLVMLGFAGYGPQVRERARTEGPGVDLSTLRFFETSRFALR